MRNLLGGEPLLVIAKLLLACLLVGWAMSYFGITLGDVVGRVAAFIDRLWRDGFAALGQMGRYVLIGAVVVIPIFVLRRLFARRG